MSFSTGDWTKLHIHIADTSVYANLFHFADLLFAIPLKRIKIINLRTKKIIKLQSDFQKLITVVRETVSEN